MINLPDYKKIHCIFVSMIDFHDALQIVMGHATPAGTEMISLEDACGRILSLDIKAPADMPPFSKSAMDGYALREADIKGACQEQPVILKVIYKTCAGDPPGRRLLPGECVRIMTGAVLPEGADCVIRQEDAG